MGGTSLMSSERHRARAAELRKVNPQSRAAVLHDLAANALAKNEPADPKVTKLAGEYSKMLDQPSADGI